MSDIEIAWAAGILEGEGCFSRHIRSSNGALCFAIHCEMSDEDVIRKLHAVFKVGTVVARLNISGRRDTRNRKQTWIWSVQNRPGIALVLNSIIPHLCQRRREKAMLILGEINEGK